MPTARLARAPFRRERTGVHRAGSARLHGRQQAVVDVHRLEGSRAGVQVTAGDVADERAERGGVGRQPKRRAGPLDGGEAAGYEADGGALDIAFDAGDLAGKAQARLGLQTKPFVENLVGYRGRCCGAGRPTGRIPPSQGQGWCGRSLSGRRASAWSESRPCSTACPAHCPDGVGLPRRLSRLGGADW